MMSVKINMKYFACNRYKSASTQAEVINCNEICFDFISVNFACNTKLRNFMQAHAQAQKRYVK